MRRSVLAILCGLAAFPAGASTIEVPDSVSTITQALLIASPGDTISVAPGTYLERLFLVDDVVLIGSDPTDRPVLDAQQMGPVVRADSCGTNTIVSDFELRNGSGVRGGGAFLSHSSVEFQRCRFELNSATQGGAIGANNSAFLVTDCEFVDNEATQAGGAISMVDPPSPTIVGCTFEGNRAQIGGAIAIRNGSDPWIEGCVLDGNEADQGAGLWFDLLSDGTVTGCTLVHQNAGPDGGAIYTSSLAQPTFQTTIIAFGIGGGATFGAGGALPHYDCLDVFGNAGGDALLGGTDAGTSFSLDPMFCDEGGGDYTLTLGSPCDANGPCGLIGALDVGCAVTGAEPRTEERSWSRVKASFR